jgi:hypothetical protein
MISDENGAVPSTQTETLIQAPFASQSVVRGPQSTPFSEQYISAPIQSSEAALQPTEPLFEIHDTRLQAQNSGPGPQYDTVMFGSSGYDNPNLIFRRSAAQANAGEEDLAHTPNSQHSLQTAYSSDNRSPPETGTRKAERLAAAMRDIYY